MRNGTGILFLALAVLFGAGVSGQGRIRVMLLDGQNNHDWRATTPVLKKMLDDTGLFDTTVVTAPEVGSPAFASFKPDFSQYRVVMMNYNNGIDGLANLDGAKCWMQSNGIVFIAITVRQPHRPNAA